MVWYIGKFYHLGVDFGVALGGSGVQERSRSSTCKLEEHSQQGFVKDGNHLGGSRGDSSKQIRMASKCGPMHPFGCGLTQGQGQGSNICPFDSNTIRLDWV